MAQGLSKKEIYERMREWRNLKKLHTAAREKVVRLEAKDKERQEEIRLLKEQNVRQAHTIEHLKLRVAELERMVFGRRKKREQDTDEEEQDAPKDKPRTPREHSSYHRPLPKEEDVTDRRHHAIHTCPDCGTILTDKTERTFYEEDITLPPDPPGKIIIKHTVEVGFCSSCRSWKSARSLPSASLILGRSVRLYICYLSILLRLSFAQIRLHLSVSYRFHISDGEIARILEKEAIRLRPEYETLKERIRAEPGVHYDETHWKVQKEEQGHYAWVMIGTETPDAVFLCGRSRGKGVAEELKGDANHTGISDDYGVYRKLFRRHQLCWSHPHRKFRDLSQVKDLEAGARERCRRTYEAFAKAYALVEDALSLPLKKRRIRTIVSRFDEAAAADAGDPRKLATLKESLRKNKASYFTCLVTEGVPADNNKAERSLRHLVLKRKISFGSKTQRGAETTGILASVLLSLYWRFGEEFFTEYSKVGV